MPDCLHCGSETEPLSVESDRPTLYRLCYEHLEEPGLKLSRATDEGTFPTLWVCPLVEVNGGE